jgi:hypothetical protein
MKPLRLPNYRAVQIGISLALAPLSPGAAFAANPEPVAAATAAPKTHVLFMGADIALEKDKVFSPVEDVTEMALVIKPGGKLVKVPMEQCVNFNISEALKIAKTSVGIDDLKFERAYTPGTDPFLKFARNAALSAGQSGPVDLARGNLLRLEMMGKQSGGSPAYQQQIAAAQTNIDASELESSREIYDIGSQSAAAGVEAMRELFDAIRLSFEVKSDEDLADPYCAVIAQIRDRDSKPGQVRRWAYLKSLGRMSAGASRKVNIYQGGFPPGFILESCEVHIYNRGAELATNLSRKRVALTDAEALEYRILEYVGTHKGRTLPASLATTTLPREVRASLTPTQLSETCYVRVARDGRVAAAFRDAAGQQPLQDPALESALKIFRYEPALETGKPVEAIVPINLSQLAPP